MSVREKEIALAFDDGRESFAMEVFEYLENFSMDDQIDVSELWQYLEDALGWIPDVDD